MNNRILYTPKEKKNFKKPKLRYRVYIFLGITAVIILFMVGAYAVRMPALQIKDISIRGLKSIDEKNIRSIVEHVLAGSYAGGMIPYRFLLSAPTQIITTDIKGQFPLIADLHITKGFPDQLALDVRERELFGIFCNDHRSADNVPEIEKRVKTQCAYVDTEGIAYQHSPQSTGFLITKISTDASSFAVPGQAIERKTIEKMIFLQQNLPALIHSPIFGFKLLSAIPHEIHAVSDDGITIMFERDDDFENVFRVLKKLLEREIGTKRSSVDYIDLRFGNKVFFKMK